MAAKLAFFFVCIFAVLYMIQADEPKKPEKTASETIDETWGKITSTFNDIVENAKNNEFIANATKAITDFGQQVQAKGKEVLEKLNTPTKQ